MVIPRSLREEAGVCEGTLMKVAVIEDGQILLTPQFTINRPALLHGRKDRKQLLKELAQTVTELRQEAKTKSLDRIPMREIRAAVTAARRSRKAGKRPAK
jgi:antitoxin component of MazEF toxin-antitoxin module